MSGVIAGVVLIVACQIAYHVGRRHGEKYVVGERFEAYHRGKMDGYTQASGEFRSFGFRRSS